MTCWCKTQLLHGILTHSILQTVKFYLIGPIKALFTYLLLFYIINNTAENEALMIPSCKLLLNPRQTQTKNHITIKKRLFQRSRKTYKKCEIFRTLNSGCLKTSSYWSAMVPKAIVVLLMLLSINKRNVKGPSSVSLLQKKKKKRRNGAEEKRGREGQVNPFLIFNVKCLKQRSISGWKRFAFTLH